MKKRYIKWDEVADIYKARTGGKAKIRPMGEIFEWAANQTDLHVDEEGYLYTVEEEK